MTGNIIASSSFSNNSDILYGAHYVTLASDKVTYENNTGKFIMSYVTPNTSSSSAYDRTLPKNNTSNVVNKATLGTTRITASNYIELEVPEYLFYITDLKITPNTSSSPECGLVYCNPKITITRKEYTKGQQFVVVNAGGNIEAPCIVGVV